MKANEENLLRFLDVTKQFIIPIYQRTYSWDISQCRQLWNDIVKAGNDDSLEGHFIGSIVYIQHGSFQVSSVPELLVIDGQQRLTTISLLLLALSEAIKKEGSIGQINYKKIMNYYLVNNEEDNDFYLKLLLTKIDKETWKSILLGKEIPSEGSRRVIDNYKFFKDQIVKTDLEKLYKGIAKLTIIDVALDKDRDNPQLIFESLNSTGLDLSQADLIRNYVLMQLDPKSQIELYTDYWFPMEKNFGHAEYSELFDRFMRDYLTLKTGKIPNIKNVYSAFKAYAKESVSVTDLVEDVYRYSKYFVNIALSKEEDKLIAGVLDNINTLKVDVSYPFLLEVYDDYVNEKLSKEEFISILELVESYILRRAVCGIPTNSLNKTFANLSKEIDKGSYVESFRAKMLLKDSYKRFPTDSEFRQELRVKDIYNTRIRNYLLDKLENYGRKERVDIGSYTIEHIMPQNENLSIEWKKDLGENWQEVQLRYLHTIGNLTLTGYNSELSDKPFIVKRNMEGGFSDSPIRINRGLAKLNVWNEEAILNRAKEITDLAIKIWKFPNLEKEKLEKYKVIETQKGRKEYTIEDHKNLTGDIKILFEALRKRILNLDSSVNEHILKLYVAYKTVTNFVDVIPKKNSLGLTLNLKYEEINDPKNKCRDITGLGRWGNGDVSVEFEKEEDLDYILFLIKQAFNKQVEIQSV